MGADSVLAFFMLTVCFSNAFSLPVARQSQNADELLGKYNEILSLSGSLGLVQSMDSSVDKIEVELETNEVEPEASLEKLETVRTSIVSDAASNQTVSDAASNQTVSDAASNQTVSDAASNQTVSDAASNQTVSDAASNQTVSDAAVRQQPDYSVPHNSPPPELCDGRGRTFQPAEELQ
ncbi:hypothetical protein OJAV_G00236920 [Oryzias javanicus]|uniref:Uncharacterized protein n=1 Tax=Oryzias javanicus TaxID=123683 RepID=A0A3S2MBE4_ORYJA|nr:hypothetical protein OJAV_G00236920 [Oryzias javanicus]